MGARVYAPPPFSVVETSTRQFVFATVAKGCVRMCVCATADSREGGKGEERCGNRISVSAMAARSVKHHLDRCLLSGGMFGRTQSGEANSLFITQARSASEIKAIYKLRRPWPGAHLKPNDDLFPLS